MPDRGTEITGEIHVEIQPFRLRERQELAAHIGTICATWAALEDELLELYAMCLGGNPALVAQAMGRVFSVHTRLNMIRDALEYAFAPEALAKFKPLRSQLEVVAADRNTVAHSMWVVHDDYPDSLIRVVGVQHPELPMYEWTLRDFLAVELEMTQAAIGLRRFTIAIVGLQRPRETWAPNYPRLPTHEHPALPGLPDFPEDDDTAEPPPDNPDETT